MVPNPFRLFMRALPGGGSSDGEESREPETDERVAPAASEADEHTSEADEQVDSGERGPEGTDTDEREDTEGADRPGSEGDSDSDDRASGEEIDASGIPAPSIGPNTTIVKEDPEDRLARHEQSDVDAMGLDKRREVIGGQYGASFAKQATLYGLFLLVVALLVVGAIFAVNEFDQPPDEQKLEAPWKDSTDPATPAELDFPIDSAPEQVPVEPDSTSSGNSDST